LQLLSAISSARPERTQECILSAPLGTTRLVAALDDPRDAVQNASLVLLTDLSNASPELQKLIAFENAFDRLFVLTAADGGLNTGGVVVQDCLSLLANLVRFNAPNQSLFRETGCVAKLAELLPGGRRLPDSEEEDWDNPQRDKNLWGVLVVLRMFLVTGSSSTMQNQNVFGKHGILQLVLNLAFNNKTSIPIRAEVCSSTSQVSNAVTLILIMAYSGVDHMRRYDPW
jgi:intracellular protein transport protein USO1